jgi:hypothetical protein
VDSPFSTRKWLAESKAWIGEELVRLGLTPVGAIVQAHIRPWSTVLKIPTNRGDLYFKASSQELHYEVALTLELMRSFPEVIPEVVAFDEGRAWMIMRDGGDPLRAILKEEPSLKHWERILPTYAELQIRCIEWVERLLEMGVPDRRLAAFPKELERLLSDANAIGLDRDEGIHSFDLPILRSEQVAELCSRLSSYGIPESLDHGDFHDGNIFSHRSGYSFFDWGDSSITHPFFSLRTAFVSLENTLQIEEGGPEVTRLTEIYLETWEPFEDRLRLLEAFDLAQRLWAISSAFRWHLVLTPLPEDQRKPYDHAVPSLLEEYLQANSAGS